MESFEQQVRERAYHLWLSAGMADGKAHEHWVSAERALLSKHAPKVAAKSKTTARKKAVAKPSEAEATAKTNNKKLSANGASGASAKNLRARPSLGERVAH